MKALLVLMAVLAAPAAAYAEIEPTSGGAIDVDLRTDPERPQLRESIKLIIDFLNPVTGQTQEHIDYTVEVIEPGGGAIFGPIPLTHTSEGKVTIPIGVLEGGLYVATITVEGILFQPIPEEFAQFEIEVKQHQIMVPPKEQGGCLIATAAYGTELAPQVQRLREARDVMVQTESGAAFMSGFSSIYYAFSPAVADLQRQSPELRAAVGLAIYPMIASLGIMEGADTEAEVLGYGIAAILANMAMYIGAPIGAIMLARRH